MAPMDAIWLVLVKTEPLPSISWLCRSATGIGSASKKLPKMAGNLAGYSPNSW